MDDRQISIIEHIKYLSSSTFVSKKPWNEQSQGKSFNDPSFNNL